MKLLNLSFLMCLAFVCNLDHLRAQDEKETATPDSKAMKVLIARQADIGADPVFQQYVDLKELDGAWTFLDAEALAGIGMKLADAERILFRTYGGIRAKDILKVAIRTSGVKGKTDVLEQLRKFAEQSKDQSLKEQIELAEQLAGRSRSMSPKLSLDDITIGGLIAYKQAKHDFDAALVHNDVKMLEDLNTQVTEWEKKEPEFWKALREDIKATLEATKSLGAPSRGGPDDVKDATAALTQLSGASRGGWNGNGGGWNGGGGGWNGNGGGWNGGGGGWNGNGGGWNGGGGGWNGNGGGWNGGGSGGWNGGTQSNYDRQYEAGVRVQDPGQLIVGGLLSGIGTGLQNKNPQKNAVAIGVLQGLGTALQISAQPSIYEREQIQQSNQGYQNFYYSP